MCAYVRSFPMVESIFATEGGDEFRAQLLESLCKAKPTLRIVTVLSGSLRLKWTVDAGETND